MIEREKMRALPAMSPFESPPFPTPPSLLRSDRSKRPLRLREASRRVRREAGPPHSDGPQGQANLPGETSLLGALRCENVGCATAEPC